MILGDPNSSEVEGGSRTTLDALFRHAIARRPDAIALADPPNRPAFTDGAPRRMSFAEADAVVTAIANRLRGLGLGTDSVVGVQLPNTAECVLTILGAMRAGMIPALVPLLWRRADAVQALGRIGAKAIVASSRIGEVDYCDLAMHLAANLFGIRHVCGFGSSLPDGVVPLDDVFLGDASGPASEIPRDGNPAAHVAVITFEATARGVVAVPRDHLQLISGGLAVVLEGRIARRRIGRGTRADRTAGAATASRQS
jgi:non-ribosomal peptide synthetase component E (peptide arylation enzyme)